MLEPIKQVSIGSPRSVERRNVHKHESARSQNIASGWSTHPPDLPSDMAGCTPPCPLATIKFCGAVWLWERRAPSRGAAAAMYMGDGTAARRGRRRHCWRKGGAATGGGATRLLTEGRRGRWRVAAGWPAGSPPHGGRPADDEGTPV
ncbi:hypothetical protein I4F81_012404 [Pyropia yezoensis]|uniref:Uncharacterized protein n=1 Tax=Pyropia yezoensis TaxID=2788 RepID=A0ACC3CID7_PYRYE|nr:hypothetical protein I4F81_012404 [Neopyropia yezoensis]